MCIGNIEDDWIVWSGRTDGKCGYEGWEREELAVIIKEKISIIMLIQSRE